MNMPFHPAIRTPSPNLHFALKRACAMTGLLSALFAMPAFADDAADVTRMLRAGQFAEGVAKADAYLAQKPRDAQMRFLKGVLLTEMNRSTEAIAIFVKLTEDYPELPEPHNNVAVLYAANGQYDKARAALDMAIRTNPAYATAYENLGDVHAKLATQAYDKALQLDSGNAAAKSKLTLLRTLGGAANSSVAVKGAAAPAVAAKAPAPAPVVVAQAPKAQPAPMPAPVVVAQAPAPKVATVPAAVTPVAPPPETKAEKQAEKLAEKQAEKSAEKAAGGQDDEVMRVVHGWASAWSARDVKGYLEYYASDFQTPGNIPRKAWADERQSRIQGKGNISVSVQSPQVSINGDTATVNFRQVYVSDRLKANTRKKLVLTKRSGKWHIRQESTGS
jgi:tetratricopeptide (TPR) repeat protein